MHCISERRKPPETTRNVPKGRAKLTQKHSFNVIGQSSNKCSRSETNQFNTSLAGLKEAGWRPNRMRAHSFVTTNSFDEGYPDPTPSPPVFLHDTEGQAVSFDECFKNSNSSWDLVQTCSNVFGCIRFVTSHFSIFVFPFSPLSHFFFASSRADQAGDPWRLPWEPWKP